MLKQLLQLPLLGSNQDSPDPESRNRSGAQRDVARRTLAPARVFPARTHENPHGFTPAQRLITALAGWRARWIERDRDELDYQVRQALRDLGPARRNAIRRWLAREELLEVGAGLIDREGGL